MAMIQNEPSRSSLKRRSRVQIDMTAMVDVAFLLLTFFVLTATITNKKYIPLTMPVADSEDRADLEESKLMTLILCANDTILYYTGGTQATLKVTDYTSQGIRQVMMQHLNKYTPICTDENQRDCWDPVFRIQPRYNAKYQSLIDILDEVAILGAHKYAISRFTAQDSLLMVGLKTDPDLQIH